MKNESQQVSGKTLAITRHSRRWTQQVLADRSGLGRSRIAHLEKQSAIPPQHIARLDQAFGGAQWRLVEVKAPLHPKKLRELESMHAQIKRAIHFLESIDNKLSDIERDVLVMH